MGFNVSRACPMCYKVYLLQHHPVAVLKLHSGSSVSLPPSPFSLPKNSQNKGQSHNSNLSFSNPNTCALKHHMILPLNKLVSTEMKCKTYKENLQILKWAHLILR